MSNVPPGMNRSLVVLSILSFLASLDCAGREQSDETSTHGDFDAADTGTDGAGGVDDGGAIDASSDPSDSTGPETDARSGSDIDIPDGERTESAADAGPGLCPGRLLVAGYQLPYGITSDGFVVCALDRGGHSEISTISVANGTPLQIGMAACGNFSQTLMRPCADEPEENFLGTAGLVIRGKTVAYEAGHLLGGGQQSDFTPWTSTGGTADLGSGSSGAPFALSTDGSQLAYWDRESLGANGGYSWMLTSVRADGWTKTPLFGRIGDRLCFNFPTVAFAGPNLLATYCTTTPPSDGGSEGGDDATAPPAVISSTATFSGPTFARWVLPSNARYVGADPMGTQLLVVEPRGLVVYPIGGGAGTNIDPDGVSGVFTKDGKSVLYVTNANALKRSPVASPAPVTLHPNGVMAIRSVSPDEKWTLLSASTGLLLASTTAPGPPTDLGVAKFFGDAFTADSKYALFLLANDLYAAPTAGGPAARVATHAGRAYATTASRIVFASEGGIGVADATDVTTAKIIVSEADGRHLYLTYEKDQLVYSSKCAPNGPIGIRLTSLPK